MSKTIILEKIKRAVKDLINLLITGQYEEVFCRGYDDPNVPFPGYLEEAMSQSYGIVGRREEKLPDKPEGLYQFIMPPEEIIDEAILNSFLCGGSNRLFDISDDDKPPLLKDIIQDREAMPDSIWHIWIDMWAVGGQTQLSLTLDCEFMSNEIRIMIDQLGVR